MEIDTLLSVGYTWRLIWVNWGRTYQRVVTCWISLLWWNLHQTSCYLNVVCNLLIHILHSDLYVCVFLDKEKEKEKLEEDEAAAASNMAVSASLMPPIWDKTIPYDGESFHLEYMDLDEFLLENGIPSSPAHLGLNQNPLLPVAELEGKESASASAASPPSSSSTVVFQPSEAASSTGRWNTLKPCGWFILLWCVKRPP